MEIAHLRSLLHGRINGLMEVDSGEEAWDVLVTDSSSFVTGVAPITSKTFPTKHKLLIDRSSTSFVR